MSALSPHAPGSPRQVLYLAWPIGVSMISFTLKGFIDMLLVGRLGIEALGAVGLASVMAWTLMSFPLGMLRGQRPLVSQYFGAGDRIAAYSYGIHAFYLAVAWGLLSLVLAGPAATLIMNLAGSKLTPDARSFAIAYLEMRLIWSGAWLMNVSVAEYLRATSRPRIGMAADLLAHPTNVALSWILIFGLFGMPAYGVQGAALGTGLADLLALCLMVWLARPRKSAKGQPWAYRWNRMKKVLTTGITGGVQFVLESGAFALITTMIGFLGTTALAVHQAAIQLVHLSIMPAVAIADGGATLIGQYIGEKKPDYAERALHSSLRICAIFMTCMGVIYFFFGEDLVSVFLKEGEGDYDTAIKLGGQVMLAAALWQLGDSYQVAFRFGLRAAGDHYWVMYVGILCSWALSVPLAWAVVHVFHGNLAHVWLSWTAEIFLGSAIFWWRWKSGAWRKKRMVDDGVDAPSTCPR
ncbi:MAG: MATE family efflux transporter [Planctomycetes bacterium]|nr:MATE family efflux transporter [Planctomycetota bacterium]